MRIPDPRSLPGPAWAWQLAVSAAFATLAVLATDIDEVLGAFTDVDPRWLAPALVVFTVAKYADSWRWRYLLRDVVTVPQRVLFSAFLVGNMVNNLLPLRAGDVAKVQVLSRRYGASRASIAASVFLAEATLDGAVLVSLLLISLIFLSPAGLPGLTGGALIASTTFAATTFLLAVLASHQAGWLERSARRLPRVGERLAQTVREVEEGLSALRGFRRLLGALLVSLPVWLLETVTFALIGEALGLDVPLEGYLLAMVAANLATSLPIALWNVGPYEALVAGALGLAGAGGTEALSFALTAHVAMSIWIQITGLAAVWVLRISPTEILSLHRSDATGRQHAEDAPDAASTPGTRD